MAIAQDDDCLAAIKDEEKKGRSASFAVDPPEVQEDPQKASEEVQQNSRGSRSPSKERSARSISKEGLPERITRKKSRKCTDLFAAQRKLKRSYTVVQDVGLTGGSYRVKLSKPLGFEESSKLGLDIDYAEENPFIPIVDISEGLASKWNEDNPKTPLRPGDTIVKVNGISKDSSKMFAAMIHSGALDILVARGEAETTGLEPVASGLLAGDAYISAQIDEDDTKQKTLLSSKSNVTEQFLRHVLSEGDDLEGVQRSSVRKPSMTWSVRG